MTRIQLVSLLLLVGGAGCVPPSATAISGGETSAAITPLDLGIRLSAFAHDSMMGRQAGTIWGEKAGDYVA
jgi:hypothetical protein